MRNGLILLIAAALGGGAGLAYAMLTPKKMPGVDIALLPHLAASASPLLCNGELAPETAVTGGRLFGHFPYSEPEANAMVAPPSDFRSGNCQLIHRDMAASLSAMIAAATKADPEVGRGLVGVSCYRSLERQRALFCNPAKLRARGLAGQARWIAPPGFSEHATGLTIDFGARSLPQCHAEPCFKNTRTSAWLAKNADRFGFELSFPENNKQGVSYESWHYRWIGSEMAKKIFAPARSAFPAGDIHRKGTRDARRPF